MFFFLSLSVNKSCFFVLENNLSVSDVSVEELLEKRLAEMRDRLRHAETLNRERTADVMGLRSQINVLMHGHRHGNV